MGDGDNLIDFDLVITAYAFNGLFCDSSEYYVSVATFAESARKMVCTLAIQTVPCPARGHTSQRDRINASGWSGITSAKGTR